MEVECLHHVQLAMPAGGEPRAREFYQGILGIPEVAKPAELARRGGCWFEHGEVRIHLGVEAEFRPARKAHPALVVRNLRALAATLEVAGFECRGDRAFSGHARLFVDDPFGNRIELLQSPARPA
jgi:catechol 2,3-dioxygenase-like lactoylglutathione lyase family enzyme